MSRIIETLHSLSEDKTIDSLQENTEPIKKTVKRKKRFPVFSFIRIAMQILFFVWMPSLYFSFFSSLSELIVSIAQGTFTWGGLWPVIMPLAVVVPVTILFGRYFCGWMCAFGSLTDWVYKIFSPLVNPNLRFTKKTDKYLKFVKYAVLLALLVLGSLAGSLSLSAMSPWDAFGMLFTVGVAPALVFVVRSLMPGLVLLILILMASAFTERFFCRYLCPMGAFFALTSGAKMSYISKPRDHCGKCRICTKQCAMGISLYDMDQVKTGECIHCMKCVSACPRKNVQITVRKTPAHAMLVSVMALCVIAGFFSLSTVLTQNTAAPGSSSMPATAQTASQTSSGMTDTTKAVLETLATEAGSATSGPTSSTSTAQTTTASSNIYKDGTFRGQGDGFRGTTLVDVTIANGVITDVTMVSYQDDAQFFNRAFPVIANSILSSQSAKVDTVSRATYSSKGIIAAVKDALNQAKN